VIDACEARLAAVTGLATCAASASGSGKLGEAGSAGAAVDSVAGYGAEPEGAAAFTYFQVHSQILHVVHFSPCSPGEPIWSAVGVARLVGCGCPAPARLVGRSVEARGWGSIRYGKTLWDKFDSTLPAGCGGDREPYGAVHRKGAARFVSVQERGGSVVVIALDKQRVNTQDLPKRAREKSPVFTGIYRRYLLHIDTYSPNIRLAE
jgi:hypothetical protein